MIRRLLLGLLAAAALSATLAAHPSPFSYLDVRPDAQSIDLTVAVHIEDVAHDLGIAPASRLLDPAFLGTQRDNVIALLRPRIQLWVNGAQLASDAWSAPEPVSDRQALQLRVRYPLSGRPSRMLVAASVFPYDPLHQTFLNVYDRDEVVFQAILDRNRQQVDFDPGVVQNTFAVIRRFIAAGVHHILIGPDHLLFLVGLLLLGGSLRQLVLVVSAFTVAHSITLSVAVFGILAPPGWVIEPAIALSIVYVGADNLTVRGGRDMRPWIAFGFGLIHGFGFASVLREMDLPRRALGWSLLSFNIGVELGQLAVVVLVTAILSTVRTRSPRAARQVAVAGSMVVIAAGAFWFVQRVFF